MLRPVSEYRPVSEADGWHPHIPSTSDISLSIAHGHAGHAVRSSSYSPRPLPRPPRRPLPRPMSVRPLPVPPPRPARPPTLCLPDEDEVPRKVRTHKHTKSASVQTASIEPSPAQVVRRPSLQVSLPVERASPVRPRGLGLHLRDSTSPPRNTREEHQHRHSGVDSHNHAESSKALSTSEDRDGALDVLEEAAESDEELSPSLSYAESLFDELEDLLMNGSGVERSFQSLGSQSSPPTSLDSLLETPPPDLPLPLKPPIVGSSQRPGLPRAHDKDFDHPDVAVFDPNESMARLEISLAKLDSYKPSPAEGLHSDSALDYSDDDESVYSEVEETDVFSVGVARGGTDNQTDEGDAGIRGRDDDDDDDAQISGLQLEQVILSITSSSPSHQQHPTPPFAATKPNASLQPIDPRARQAMPSALSLLPRFEFETPELSSASLPQKKLPPTPSSLSPVQLNSATSLPSLSTRNSSMPRLPNPPVWITSRSAASQPVWGVRGADASKSKEGTAGSSGSERPSLSRRKSRSVPFLLRAVRDSQTADSGSSSVPPPPVPHRTAAHAVLTSRAAGAPRSQKPLPTSLSSAELSQKPLPSPLPSAGLSPKLFPFPDSARAPRTPPREAREIPGSFMNMNLTPEEEDNRASVMGMSRLRDKLGKSAGIVKQKGSRWLRGSTQI